MISVSAEELQSCKEKVTFSLSARDLDKKDFFGKSDPFLAFYKANEDGTYTVVHRTEVIKNTLMPTWKPFSLSVQSLCGNDYNRLPVSCVILNCKHIFSDLFWSNVSIGTETVPKT